MIKKIVLMGALIGALTAAQAVEIGITDGNNFTKNENVWGLTVVLHVAKLATHTALSVQKTLQNLAQHQLQQKQVAHTPILKASQQVTQLLLVLVQQYH